MTSGAAAAGHVGAGVFTGRRPTVPPQHLAIMAILGRGTILVALASAATAFLSLQAPLPAPTFTPGGDTGLYM